MAGEKKEKKSGSRRDLLAHKTTQMVWYALSASFHYEGRCPTYRELAGRVGCSIGSVQRHLMKLEIAGVVFWLPGAARSVVLRRAHPHWQRDHEAGLARMRKFGGREHVRAALKDDIW